MEWARLVGNLANVTTPLGLGVAAIGRARIRRGPRGLVLADGYRLAFPVARAFTVGSVLITAAPDWSGLHSDTPGTFAHEERHTYQWLCFGGVLFLIPYTVAMGWSWLRTGDRATANVFEQLAGLADGGYRELPRRSPREGLAALRHPWEGLGRIVLNWSGSARTRAGGRTGRADAPSGADGAV